LLAALGDGAAERTQALRRLFVVPVEREEGRRMAKRVSVLVAEDETIIRLDLCAQLEESEYTVCGQATNGHEAVALARTLQPDIALLDVKMPGLDGIEAARMILAERPIPILMLTAYNDEQLVRRAAKAGVYAYLVKPFRPADLMPAIETAVARYEEMQALREETATLADALAARKAIERAKGLLMEREGLSEADAFARLRRASQISGQPLKAIAEAVVAALA
jgi:two-component system, response regulator PdtaR